MPWTLAPFEDAGLDAETLEHALAEHTRLEVPRLQTLWAYFRNPMTAPHPHAPGAGGGASGRPYRLAQERGLPARLSGNAGRNPGADDRAAARREVVIENDIAWRVQAMVDFLFAKPVRVLSRAADPALRARLDDFLEQAWEHAGGTALLQDAGLLGHVYGHVDLLVRGHALAGVARGDLVDAARALRVELVEPLRATALLSPDDFRTLDAYIVHHAAPARGTAPPRRVTEIFSRAWRQLYAHARGGEHDADGRRLDAGEPILVDEGPNDVEPGRVPVAHVQNVSQPFAYAGLSEVEPLIPLQDELNTRLSDRASRVTLQSFQMYLAKGLDGFERSPVGPGQVWSTDNPQASIEAFGGDAASPSEEAHIDQIREALDKASSLPPLATGVVRAKVGNLTSENALRLTLGGVLTRTARKRLLYGRGISTVCELMLAALDRHGILATTPADRRVVVQWPDPLPQSVSEQLTQARGKRELGVGDEQVLAELGYGRGDTGLD